MISITSETNDTLLKTIIYCWIVIITNYCLCGQCCEIVLPKSVRVHSKILQKAGVHHNSMVMVVLLNLRTFLHLYVVYFIDVIQLYVTKIWIITENLSKTCNKRNNDILYFVKDNIYFSCLECQCDLSLLWIQLTQHSVNPAQRFLQHVAFLSAAKYYTFNFNLQIIRSVIHFKLF